MLVAVHAVVRRCSPSCMTVCDVFHVLVLLVFSYCTKKYFLNIVLYSPNYHPKYTHKPSFLNNCYNRNAQNSTDMNVILQTFFKASS